MKIIKALVMMFFTLGVCACSSSGDTRQEEINADTPKVVQPAAIQEQTLYQSENVQLVVKSLEVKDSTTTLTFYAKNNFDTTLQVEVYTSSINGYTIDPSSNIFINLNFESDGEFTLTFYNDELLNHQIFYLTEFEFIFNLYQLNEEFEVNDSTTSDVVVIKTDLYDSYQTTYDDLGTVLYDQHDVRILSKGVVNGELTLYLENNSDSKISLVYKLSDSIQDYMSTVINMTGQKKAIRKTFISEGDLPTGLELYIGIENLDTHELIDSITIPLEV